MFFAMLALQPEFELDGGGLLDDDAVGGYFLEAVHWLAFGNRQNREDMLLVAVEYALAIGHIYLEAVPCLFDESFVFHHDIVIFLIFGGYVGLLKDALVIDGHLEDGIVGGTSLGRENGGASGLPLQFGLADGGVGLEVNIAGSSTDGLLFLSLGVVEGQGGSLGVGRVGDGDPGFLFGRRVVFLRVKAAPHEYQECLI